MSLQIAKIVIYGHAGQSRVLDFRLGQLNVLTGASKSGKSAIIDIIDYCTGRGDCNVPDGVIRKYVSWYAVIFQHNESQILIARKNPPPGEKTNPDVYLERAAKIDVPPITRFIKNTTVSAVEEFLGAAIGISENKHRPPELTRDPLEANFRHALLFSFQDQNDIDSKARLFHRQGEDFVGQAIRDTMPYFLGAIDEDHLLKQSQLDQAKRQLRQLERQLREAESVDESTFPRARSLLEEAKQVGLLDDRAVATTYASAVAMLRQIVQENRTHPNTFVGDGEDVVAGLRAERQGLRAELERVHAETRSTRTFSSETSGYEKEAKEQRGRLSSIGLIKKTDHSGKHCPLCESELVSTIPTVEQITGALNEISTQLEIVEAENPRLQARLASLMRQAALIEERLRENQQLINNRIRENEIIRVQQDTFVLQARTAGKISQYVETASDVDAGSSLKNSVEMMRARVQTLERELDPNSTRDKLSAFLNIIGRYMTDYSQSLDLEQKGSQLRLDIRQLTVVADTLDGAVPLYRMGSGENWVGYHILAHISLHKWFRQKGRPVPGFVIFDQPSQAHYPPERDAEGSVDVLSNEDRTAVAQLFKLLADAGKELAPNLQIIVMDHADLQQSWFSDAVIERWRKGKKLVPQEWIN
jgi:chaperonin cofactor prefoldin